MDGVSKYALQFNPDLPILYLTYLSPNPQFYFAALIYSYAIHLRKGSYRSLPCSNPSPSSQYYDSVRTSDFPESVLGLGDEEGMTDGDDDEIERGVAETRHLTKKGQQMMRMMR